MSSSPCQEPFSAVTIKRVDGGRISNWFCDQVKVGNILRARGPIGKFVFDPTLDQSHLVMVAGGSGVTPFVSILREYADKLGQPHAPHQMTLLVSHRSHADIICAADLAAIDHISGIKVITTLSREDKRAEGFWFGRLDEDKLSQALAGTYQSATYMTCGPKAIMDQTVAHLQKMQVPETRIKTESFES